MLFSGAELQHFKDAFSLHSHSVNDCGHVRQLCLPCKQAQTSDPAALDVTQIGAQQGFMERPIQYLCRAPSKGVSCQEKAKCIKLCS